MDEYLNFGSSETDGEDQESTDEYSVVIPEFDENNNMLPEGLIVPLIGGVTDLERNEVTVPGMDGKLIRVRKSASNRIQKCINCGLPATWKVPPKDQSEEHMDMGKESKALPEEQLSMLNDLIGNTEVDNTSSRGILASSLLTVMNTLMDSFEVSEAQIAISNEERILVLSNQYALNLGDGEIVLLISEECKDTLLISKVTLLVSNMGNNFGWKTKVDGYFKVREKEDNDNGNDANKS